MSKPDIHETVFLAEGARVLGDVVIGEGASVWYNAVIRGDRAPIRIGKGSNVQDCVVIHEGVGYPVEIGDGVTIGHGAVVHGCRVGNHSLIGMGAILLNGAVVGEECLVGAGALVTGKMVIPDGMLVLGSPARAVRPLTDEEKADIRKSAESYRMEAAVRRKA